MGHVIVYCTGWVLDRAPRTKETMSDFGQIMDPDKWDTMVCYRVTRYSQAFRGLMSDQRTPKF